MATPSFDNRIGARGQVESVIVTWGPGEAEAIALDLLDRCVQVAGDFGGGAVTIEGSNDGQAYFTLADGPGAVGYPLVFNTPGIKSIADNPLWLRPRRDGAAKTTTVILVGRPR